MNENLQCIIKSCEILGLSYRVLHDTKNLLQVNTGNKPVVFANWATPLNDHSTARTCSDKEYSYRYFGQWIKMPHTAGYLDPDIDDMYRNYLRYTTIPDIGDHIESVFNYPCIVKRNAGSRGIHVFQCNTRDKVLHALQEIFTRGRKNYDYVAIAQEYINSAHEYRVITYKQEIALVYEKIAGSIDSSGNISPLHTHGGKTITVNDPELLDAVSTFIKPLQINSPLNFAGLDIILDTAGTWWLLEVNSAPAFAYFIRDNGDEKVVRIFTRMLHDLAGK